VLTIDRLVVQAIENGVEDLPPCRVAVKNFVPYHFEILESIASLLPIHNLDLALNASEQACDSSSLVFDYFISNRIQDIKGQRWAAYFQEEMENRIVKDLSTNDSDLLARRSIGNLYRKRYPVVDNYNAIVEATCSCNEDAKDTMITKRGHTCIFHEACPKYANNSRAVWLTPFKHNYFIPSVLPPMVAKQVKQKEDQILCAVGASGRRDFTLLNNFLQINRSLANFKFRLLGALTTDTSGNGFSTLMSKYKDLVEVSAPHDFVEFHNQVQQCDGILALQTKKRCPNYFGGLQKLTGVIPILVTYNIPAVIHEDLLEIYRDHLPADTVVYETHSDEPGSFVQALDRFLDRLATSQESNSTSKKQQAEKTRSPLNTAPLGFNDTAEEQTIHLRSLILEHTGSAKVALESDCQVQFKDPSFSICHYLPKGNNFGDELGPVVARRILQEYFDCKSVNVHVHNLAQGGRKKVQHCLLTVGSILHMSSPGDHVWGTGVNPYWSTRKKFNGLTFYALRGPHSTDLIRRKLGSLPSSIGHGDPGFLVPYFFPEYYHQYTANQSSGVCLIPHYHDLGSPAVKAVERLYDARMISPHSSWKDVFDQIQTCGSVVSSSLHGLVVADSLGIPSVWVQFNGTTTSVSEGMFKYMDYFESYQKERNVTGPVRDPREIRSILQQQNPVSKSHRDDFARMAIESFPIGLFERIPIK
jgi:pyruvyltransferase